MGNEMTVSVTLVVVECGECGTPYALSRMRTSHNDHTCPYCAKRRMRELYAQLTSTEATARALRGVVTRLKNARPKQTKGRRARKAKPSP